MFLTKRQTAAVLFALRNLQDEMHDAPPEEWDYGEWADGKPLTMEEIDILCERINHG